MRKICAERLRTALSASIAGGHLNEVLNELTRDELEFIAWDWQVWAREDQLAPADAAPPALAEHASSNGAADWRVWMVLGGRGSGKTRAGAEWVRSIACAASGRQRTAKAGRGSARIALIGKTLVDVRNVMVEGQSGLLAIHPRHERPLFEPSKRRLTWPNGSIAELFSADEAESLRGPQFSAAWCDELAKWRGAERAWDMLQFALRLGEKPRAVVTTTPRASKTLRKIIADAATMSVKLATADNEMNLAPTFLAEMTRRYGGSALGRQELYGDLLDETADGLWRRHWFEEARVGAAPEMRRVVVAVDPPVTATARSDACGIIVAGLADDRRAYVIADRTIQGRSPEVWAKAALAAYDDFGADCLVAEVNQGGDMVVSVLKQFRENLPVVKVRASRGKWVRAEPVAALYAEGRVAHAGCFEALEDQMCSFGGDGTVAGKSPDRADALVWAITELLLKDGAKPALRAL